MSFPNKQKYNLTEDEYDLLIAEEAYREYAESGFKSTPMADFWKELEEEQS